MYEMGKMTKHKCDWKPTQLEAAIAAKELYAHTAAILGNPNQFKPRYDLDRMTLREAVRTVMEVYKCCYKANEINAKDNPMLARRRLALQSEAIVSAKWLQALQDVIHGQFHVDAREGAVFLGFLHRVADSGKVLVSCDPAKVKANRRKMRRIANKIMRRRANRTVLAESWQSMYNHLAKGNSQRLERRMTELYNNLEKEIEGATP